MESKRLAGKIAVVTAAGSGIGRASAEAFALAVLGADIDAKALQTVVGCESHLRDLRDTDTIAAFAKTFDFASQCRALAGIGPARQMSNLGQAG